MFLFPLIFVSGIPDAGAAPFGLAPVLASRYFSLVAGLFALILAAALLLLAAGGSSRPPRALPRRRSHRTHPRA